MEYGIGLRWYFLRNSFINTEGEHKHTHTSFSFCLNECNTILLVGNQLVTAFCLHIIQAHTHAKYLVTLLLLPKQSVFVLLLLLKIITYLKLYFINDHTVTLLPSVVVQQIYVLLLLCSHLFLSNWTVQQ
jgi:hypothetical protein